MPAFQISDATMALIQQAYADHDAAAHADDDHDAAETEMHDAIAHEAECKDASLLAHKIASGSAHDALDALAKELEYVTPLVVADTASSH